MTEQAFHSYLTWAWLAFAVPVFLALFFISAPYGRHFRTSWGASLGPIAGWILMETPAALIFATCVLAQGWPASPVVIVFLIMWQIHYLQRAFVYPFLLRSRKPMSILVVVLAVVFNVMNGYINGRWVGAFAPGWDDTWFYDPRFIAGTLLFVAGFVINVASDRALRHMRRPGETAYAIPRGGLFEYVSCPNYFGEILEWTGWAIATWSLAGMTFALWTFANLAPRARAHHLWYKKSFPEYPERRKAVIPFVF